MKDAMVTKVADALYSMKWDQAKAFEAMDITTLIFKETKTLTLVLSRGTKIMSFFRLSPKDARQVGSWLIKFADECEGK